MISGYRFGISFLASNYVQKVRYIGNIQKVGISNKINKIYLENLFFEMKR